MWVRKRGCPKRAVFFFESEPIKLIITFELPKDCFHFYWSFASVFFSFFTMEQDSSFVFERVESMIDFYASVVFGFVTQPHVEGNLRIFGLDNTLLGHIAIV